MPRKQTLQDLDSDTQEAVLANKSIPWMEAQITAAATSADNELLADLTREYNRARGLPVGDDTADTTGTAGSYNRGPDRAIDEYDEMTRPDLVEAASALTVEGTGKNGYVTAEDYRKALRHHDEEGAS